MRVLKPNSHSKITILRTDDHIFTGQEWEFKGWNKEQYRNYTLTENVIFVLSIKYDDFHSGKRPAYFFKDECNHWYSMTPSSMAALIQLIESEDIELLDGYFTGIFTIRKNGSTYSLHPVKE